MYRKTYRQTEPERGRQEGREGERGRIWTLPSIPHHPYIVVTDLRRPDGVIALQKETTIYTHVKRVPEHTPNKTRYRRVHRSNRCGTYLCACVHTLGCVCV